MRSKGQGLTVFLLLACAAVAMGLASIRSTSQESRKRPRITREEKERAFPIVDFDAPELTDKAFREQREEKSKRYDKSSGQRIEEPPFPLSVIRSSSWADKLTGIPMTESDAIVIATLTDAAAHLSNDKTGVYSEFNCRLEEVLKSDCSLPIGSTLVLQRFGGTVRFRSGLTITFETAGQGMPLPGRRYIFFLKAIKESSDFRIITAYDVTDSAIAPLDGSSADESTRSYPFDEYKSYDVSKFLDRVRQMLSTSN